MYAVTDNVRTLLNSDAKQTAKIQITSASGETTITLTDADILSGGLEIDRYSQTGDEIQIGTSIAQELKLSLLLSEKLDGAALEGAEVFVQVGVEDTLTPRELLTENGLTLTTEDEERLEIEAFNTLPADTTYTTVYIPMGYYIVDEVERSANGIDLTALDRMILFDQYVDPSVLAFPCTVGDLLLDICDAVGVLLKDPSVSELTNSDYNIDMMPTDENLTYRSLLNWIGQITGTCAFMDEEGLLRLQWYEDTSIEIDETVRYSSNLNERPITITGVQVEETAGNVVHDNGENYDPTYVLRIEGNHLIQSNAQSVADALGSKLRGFTYTPFEADTLPMPYLWIMDKIQFVRGGVKTPVILTNVNYVLNGATALAGKGKTETENKSAAPSAFTPEQTKINEWIRNETDRKIAETRNMSDYFSDIASTAMGMYKTVIPDENGGEKVYMHDAPLLEDSRYIATANSNGAFFTNSGWNNGNPQWIGGTDKNANALVSLLDAIGIKAEWIQADSITTDKLTIGLSERGTNVILDSSFESNALVSLAEYDEAGNITSPAQNAYWKAVTFGGTAKWDVQMYNEFPIIGLGGFDGNRAALDANMKGLAEGEAPYFIGVMTANPFEVDVSKYTVSFYYRVKPGVYPGAPETANFKYAVKIQWLDALQSELQTDLLTFVVSGGSSSGWDRRYTTVTSPNSAKFANLAIGYVCTDKPYEWQDEEAGEMGHSDVGFASLDGILMEKGLEPGDWTCAASEVDNIGVLFDSNGMRIETNKLCVMDETGRWLYADGNQILTLVGNLITQVRNNRTGKVLGQLEIKSTTEHGMSETVSGMLGLDFKIADDNGELKNVGTFGFKVNNDESVGEDIDDQMYFNCNGGYKFGDARPLISDPQRIPENGSINNLYMPPGWYYNERSDQAGTIAGVPEATAFVLRVETFDEEGIRLQTFSTWDGSRVYKRGYQTWGTAGWQGWRRYSADMADDGAISRENAYFNYVAISGHFFAYGSEESSMSGPLRVRNTIYAQSFTNTSDRSEKQNITERSDLQAVERIKPMKFYSYDYVEEEKVTAESDTNKPSKAKTVQRTPMHTDLGIMADEAPQEIVSEDGKGISLYPYISLCAKAIQELTAKLEEQEQKISTLESRLEESDA